MVWVEHEIACWPAMLSCVADVGQRWAAGQQQYTILQTRRCQPLECQPTRESARVVQRGVGGGRRGLGPIRERWGEVVTAASKSGSCCSLFRVVATASPPCTSATRSSQSASAYSALMSFMQEVATSVVLKRNKTQHRIFSEAHSTISRVVDNGKLAVMITTPSRRCPSAASALSFPGNSTKCAARLWVIYCQQHGLAQPHSPSRCQAQALPLLERKARHRQRHEEGTHEY